MKKPNLVIVQAKKEAYEAGLKIGYRNGYAAGEMGAIKKLATKFDGLDKVPGIGPKMIEKFKNHFGREFFKKVEKK